MLITVFKTKNITEFYWEHMDSQSLIINQELFLCHPGTIIVSQHYIFLSIHFKNLFSIIFIENQLQPYSDRFHLLIHFKN